MNDQGRVKSSQTAALHGFRSHEPVDGQNYRIISHELFACFQQRLEHGNRDARDLLLSVDLTDSLEIPKEHPGSRPSRVLIHRRNPTVLVEGCLLYTSDAA